MLAFIRFREWMEAGHVAQQRAASDALAPAATRIRGIMANALPEAGFQAGHVRPNGGGSQVLNPEPMITHEDIAISIT